MLVSNREAFWLGSGLSIADRLANRLSIEVSPLSVEASNNQLTWLAFSTKNASHFILNLAS